jgi:hypothetical protein
MSGIGEKLKQLCNAFNAHDLDGVMSHFADDCILEMPRGDHGPVIRELLSRQILDLRYSEERSCEEISRVLGLGLDAVYQRLSRLHRAIKHCTERRLTGEGPQAGVELS